MISQLTLGSLALGPRLRRTLSIQAAHKGIETENTLRLPAPLTERGKVARSRLIATDRQDRAAIMLYRTIELTPDENGHAIYAW